MASLETIDDDCDRNGIILVKLDNPQEAQQYGIDEIPSLVYFEDTIPHLFEGNLGKQEEPYLNSSCSRNLKQFGNPKCLVEKMRAHF